MYRRATCFIYNLSECWEHVDLDTMEEMEFPPIHRHDRMLATFLAKNEGLVGLLDKVKLVPSPAFGALMSATRSGIPNHFVVRAIRQCCQNGFLKNR